MRVLWPLALFATIAAGPVSAEKLNLERCVELAMDVSTQVGISQEQLRTARGDVLSSYGPWIPNLSLNSYAGHSFAGPSSGVQVDAQGRPILPAGFNYEAYTFGLSSSLTFFNFGVTSNSVDRAKRNADAAGYDLEYQRDFVKALVIREYYELLRQKKLHDVQKEDVEAKRRNLEQIEAFYNIGSRTKADFLQARVNLANSELELLNRQNAAAIADARLKSRLNMPLDADLEIDESLTINPMDVELSSEVEFMMTHRSDLLASRYRIEATRSGLTVAERSRYPALNGSFSYGWNDRAFPDNVDFFSNNYVWSVGVSLNWQIFDSFQSKSSIQNAKAQHRIAEYNLQQAKLDAILDVKQIVLNLELAQERLSLAEETVAHAEENKRLAEERYRVGAGTILETIEASASLVQAQASLVDARVDYLINHADLQRATGRPISTQ